MSLFSFIFDNWAIEREMTAAFADLQQAAENVELQETAATEPPPRDRYDMKPFLLDRRSVHFSRKGGIYVNVPLTRPTGKIDFRRVSDRSAPTSWLTSRKAKTKEMVESIETPQDDSPDQEHNDLIEQKIDELIGNVFE